MRRPAPRRDADFPDGGPGRRLADRARPQDRGRAAHRSFSRSSSASISGPSLIFWPAAAACRVRSRSPRRWCRRWRRWSASCSSSRPPWRARCTTSSPTPRATSRHSTGASPSSPRGFPSSAGAAPPLGSRACWRARSPSSLTAVRGAVVPYLKSSLEVLIEGVSVFGHGALPGPPSGHLHQRRRGPRPPARRPLALRILPDLGTTLRAWVIGQITAMFILGLLTTLGLWILGVP